MAAQLTSDQDTLQQDEQQEAQDVQSGDYSAASTDAQQAYQQSETVAGEGGPDNTDETWTAQLDESYASSDQQTAEEDATTAASYADDTTGNPDDAADAQGSTATQPQARSRLPTARPNWASTAIRLVRKWMRQRIQQKTRRSTIRPLMSTPVYDTPVDDSTVDDDSLAT